MCGIVGIFGHDYVAQDVYDGMVTLQHRGQDAAGIITYDGKFHSRKAIGLVKDVFHTRHMKRLQGYAGIGHTRYATMGGNSVEEAQPFLGQSPFGVVMVHNGNLFNAPELRKEMYEKDRRLINSTSDGEILLNMFTKYLSNSIEEDLEVEHVWDSVESVYKRSKGAYSVISYIAGKGMVAFRDPHGIRPLLMGKKTTDKGEDYIFASESVTLDILGYELVGDLDAGEAVFIEEKTREVHRKKIMTKKHIPCIFEYIYFARPDSLINNISVYKSRLRMGKRLADKVKELDLDIDVVMPVPDSSRSAALAVADELGIRYREGLVKNRYIGRTFIMPGQKVRKKSIRYKLNPMQLEIKGKKILLVDDSIVRGNTSKKIVEMMRAAGAEKVYFCSYSPPVVSPCLYGIDIPTREELIAAGSSIEEIREFIGADKLIYTDVEDAFESCAQGNKNLNDMCMACFDGKYKTGDIDEKVLAANADTRINDKACDVFEDEM